MSDLAAELVGRACAVTPSGATANELRGKPEVRAMLSADEGTRRECVLALAWCMILDLGWDHPWDQHTEHLLRLVARKPAPLTYDDLAPLVEEAESPRHHGDVTPEWTMAALTPQFRALYGRDARAASLIRRAAALCHYKADIERLTGIVGTPPSGRIKAVLEAGGDPERVAAAVIDALLEADDLRADEALACALIADLGGPPAQLRKLAAKAAAGERSLKLANTCVRAIADVNELVALERATTHGTVRREISKALDRIARAQGLTRAQLEERTVDSHGLDADGVAHVGQARIELRDLKVRVTGAPASTVADRAKAIRRTLAAERARLDRLLALQPTWDAADWRRLYLDHPITGQLARRLVWRYDGERTGLPEDAGGARSISLWHPLDSTREELLAWRSRLLAGLVVQPFRQAFRELYVITPEEERTGGHSNRFAGHVFRQAQARALMKRRGWKPVAAAWWDDGIEHGVARRLFESAQVRVEFFYDPIEDLEPDDSGLHRYCTSDQVRFFRANSDDALDLPDIPPVVFSEAMRDVDLFVSVSSIGADPDWHARADGRRFERYWDEVNFGPLGAAGEVRRDLLAELLPRLPIRAELDDRHLIVTTDRTYRIHLGSGQTRMSPGDVRTRIAPTPARRRAAQLYLPVDDDAILITVLATALSV